MIRTFFPIGQGNFAAEKFMDANIVFDCGSSSGAANVEQQIKDAFQQGAVIEKVFVSHLDDDHVNGLQILLSYCRVNEVYIPYLTKEERILTELFYFLENGKELPYFTMNSLRNPVSSITEQSPETQVIFVYPEDDNPEDDNPEDDNPEDDYPEDYNLEDDYPQNDHSPKPKPMKSGTPLPLSPQECLNWIFIPYNFQNKTRKELFIDILKREGYAISGLPKDIISSSFWRSKYEELKERVYKRIPGGLNTNSMVVYSGLKDEKKLKSRIYKNTYDCCCSNSYPEGCLYTGDYHAAGYNEWEQLKEKFADVWEHIGTVQVPHHGSKYSYQPELSKMNANLVIQAGYQNRYRHPHASVLKDLIDNKASFYWVNEHVESVIRLEVN
jgi:beta-lactamase superfamily II metal-dependent hydrolase